MQESTIGSGRWIGSAWNFTATSLRWAITMLCVPWKLAVAMKRSLTSASVTLMLIAFMSLNIVWGYPWTGMLAACLASLVLGLMANWLTRAKLAVGYSLPTSVSVGQPFRVVAHLTHTRRLPALDTLVSFDHRSKSTVFTSRKGFDLADASPPEFFPLIKSHERKEYAALLQFHRRGIHTLPPLLIQSTFPFYLFRWAATASVGAEIAVTPIPLDDDQDHVARRVLSSVGSWARRLLAGDASEYAGSREYQTGMPVRRWDFASWARLGRPIVREYKAPSVRSMNLIVDTASLEHDSVGGATSVDDSFEYLMSMSVSVLKRLSGTSVEVQMFLADETIPSADDEISPAARAFSHDRDTPLIRLAKSTSVDLSVADANIDAIVEQLGRDPTLLLTRRSAEQFERLGGDISVISIDEKSLDSNGVSQPSDGSDFAGAPARPVADSQSSLQRMQP